MNYYHSQVPVTHINMPINSTIGVNLDAVAKHLEDLASCSVAPTCSATDFKFSRIQKSVETGDNSDSGEDSASGTGNGAGDEEGPVIGTRWADVTFKYIVLCSALGCTPASGLRV